MEPNNKLLRCEKCGRYYDPAVHDECPICKEPEHKIVRCKKCGYYRDTAVNDRCPRCGSDEVAERRQVEPPPFPPDTFTEDPAPWQAKCPKCGRWYDSRKYNECPICRAAEIAENTVGWLLVIKGPDIGTTFPLGEGYNYIGREYGEIKLPNDREISREKNAEVAYNPKDGSFYFGPTDGRNIVRLNGKLAFKAEELHDGDVIKVGMTELKFISLEDANKGS